MGSSVGLLEVGAAAKRLEADVEVERLSDTSARQQEVDRIEAGDKHWVEDSCKGLGKMGNWVSEGAPRAFGEFEVQSAQVQVIIQFETDLNSFPALS